MAPSPGTQDGASKPTNKRRTTGMLHIAGGKRRRTKSRQIKSTLEPAEGPFMSLPAEMRNIIYELVLVDEDRIVIKGCRKWKEPGLLQVSKLIRNETWQMYYKENTFELHVSMADFALARSFIRRIHEKSIALLAGKNNAKTFPDATVVLIGLHWHKVDKLFPIAEATRDYGRDMFASSTYNLGRTGPDWRFNGPFEAILEVAEMGLKAREEGWQAEKLRGYWEGWLAALPEQARNMSYLFGSRAAKRNATN